jgi:PAS domain S-box-containing protein
VYCSILIGFSLFLLIRHSGRSHKIYQTQSLIIAIGIAVPLLGAIFTLIRFRFGALAEITPFTFALGNILIAWGLYRHRFLEIVPFGRDKVFEAMVEPVVILDNQHRVVDINTSMLDLLGQSAVDVVGKSAKEVFVDFPIPIKLYTHVSYARAETTFQIGSRNVHYEMTVWPLYDANRKMTGRIYISHDITALKELEGELRNLNQRLEQRVHERTRELAEAYDTTLEGWARALELRDKETEGHSRRVVTITLLLARAIDLPEDEIIHLRRGAILHDIGKIAIPDEILRKKGGLTEEERAIIRVHPETAYQLLSQVPYLKKALDIPYCHHERWDGNGYPRGLKGREIPLAARIFAIADVWDALSFDRPYNKAWSREKILAYFMEESSKQFDPRLVEVFLMMVEKGEI